MSSSVDGSTEPIRGHDHGSQPLWLEQVVTESCGGESHGDRHAIQGAVTEYTGQTITGNHLFGNSSNGFFGLGLLARDWIGWTIGCTLRGWTL